ncbi:MAG: hypothetical protein IJH12_08120 [Clostridia bacterium]|nr:hypothetical protein [Clostridia bacterium]
MSIKKIVKLVCVLVTMVVLLVGCSNAEQEDNCTNKNNTVRYNIYGGSTDDKPIIYLYPTEKMDISVKLGKAENLTCTYPKYENGWEVTANPDGSMIDKTTGRNLYALYWEGKNTTEYDTSYGFIVKSEDTIKFLEEKLKILGLNDREAEEFIVYWLPQMQSNKYNYVRFATEEEINENMPLTFSTEPDTLIRVLMIWKPLEEQIEIPEQQLNSVERKGFVAVEWGGTKLENAAMVE